MLRHEDPRTGAGNDELQEVYRHEFGREGVYDIHMGRTRRELLQMVVLPRWNVTSVKGERRQFTHKPLQPIMHHDDVEFLMMWDRPRLYAEPKARKIQTVALVQHGRLDNKGSVLISSGRGGGGTLWVDFARPMFRTHQAGVPCRNIGTLTAGLLGKPGRLLLVRHDGRLDICLDRLPNGDPAILYRFDVTAFQGDDPRAVLLQGTLPVDDGQVDAGVVKPDTAVVQIRKTCDFIQASVERGRFKIKYARPPWSWDLSNEYQRYLFSVCNDMNRYLNDIALGGLTLAEDPDTWAPEVLVEFSANTFENLASLDDWAPSRELLADLVAGLRPGGSFRLVAEHTGELVSCAAAEHNPQLQCLTFSTGAQQFFPACARITAPLGAQVVRGQELGWPLEPGFYTQDVLRQRLGSNFAWLVEAFVRASAVYPEQSEIPGILVPVQYSRSVLSHARREAGGFVWFWDFRRGWCYLDNGMLFPPAMRYRNESVMQLGHITLRVGTPKEANRSRRKSRQQTPERVAAVA